MKNELSEFMKEVTKQIITLKNNVEHLTTFTSKLEERMDIIQEDLGEMAKVSNKTLNDSITKLSEMMNNE